MTTKIFLSGAIDYVGDYAVYWRKEASLALTSLGYTVLDPTTVRDDHTSMSPEEIAQKNLFLQKKADLILVEYMLKDRAYIGTDFELAWAKIHGQPSVVICSPHYSNRVYMKYMATKLADNIEDAIDYISVNYPTK